MTDINKKIFTRLSAKNKLAMVNALTDDELLRTSKQTILRIVKEVGDGKKGSKYKYLSLPKDFKECGNDWNSLVESIYVTKESLGLDFYIQYGNTDSGYSDTYEKFFGRADYRGHITDTDRFGHPQTYYFNYYSYHKARVIRTILLQYLHRKYADKL